MKWECKRTCRMSARHMRSQASPMLPTTRSSEAGPQAAAMEGSTCGRGGWEQLRQLRDGPEAMAG